MSKKKGQYADKNYVERNMFKKFENFQWGIDTKVVINNKDDQNIPSKAMVFIPLYDMFGGSNTSESNSIKKQILNGSEADTVSLKHNKFALRYFKIDEAKDEEYLVNLKVSASISTENFDQTERELVFQFPPESIKKIVRHKRDDSSNLTDLYITVSYLPEVILMTKTTFGGEMKRIPNPLCSDRAIDNCVISQLMFRVTGTFDKSYEEEFSEVFGSVMNENNLRYARISKDEEAVMTKN